jgi:integrase
MPARCKRSWPDGPGLSAAISLGRSPQQTSNTSRPGAAAKDKVNRGLTTIQARAVLRAATGTRLYARYVLALCLGLRRGELLGLRWEDIDLDSEKLEVVQTFQRVRGRLRFIRPKTDDSERTVPLPPLCVEALREDKKRQFAERSAAWPGRPPVRRDHVPSARNWRRDRPLCRRSYFHQDAMRRLPSELSGKTTRSSCFSRSQKWSGAGSNCRPSAFQAGQ